MKVARVSQDVRKNALRQEGDWHAQERNGVVFVRLELMGKF